MAEAIQGTCRHHGLTDFYKSPSMRTSKCKKCNTERVSKHRRKVISILKAEYGNSCKECGYSACIEALEFHHLDPNTKDESVNSGNTRSIERLRLEAKKCVLLCANCHREVHAGIRSLSSNR